jgi:hypothetical protein
MFLLLLKLSLCSKGDRGFWLKMFVIFMLCEYFVYGNNINAQR